jgi:hypothetical protein
MAVFAVTVGSIFWAGEFIFLPEDVAEQLGLSPKKGTEGQNQMRQRSVVKMTTTTAGFVFHDAFQQIAL